MYRSRGARSPSFDTLAYAKRLRDAGIPQEQAEADAEAARSYIMAELVTKKDLRLALRLTMRLGLMLGALVGIF